MLKVMVACAYGVAISQMLKIEAKEVFKNLGIAVTINHANVEEAVLIASEYDVVIVSEALVKNFDKTKVIVIGLKNILSKKEMTEKLQASYFGK